MSKKIKHKPSSTDEDKKFPLPIYKKEDDIYNQDEEVSLGNAHNPKSKKSAKKDKDPADDLDIPGTELDDRDEAIGEEDEENNYYSLGGDRHEDLEEDKE